MSKAASVVVGVSGAAGVVVTEGGVSTASAVAAQSAASPVIWRCPGSGLAVDPETPGAVCDMQRHMPAPVAAAQVPTQSASAPESFPDFALMIQHAIALALAPVQEDIAKTRNRLATLHRWQESLQKELAAVRSQLFTDDQSDEELDERPPVRGPQLVSIAGEDSTVHQPAIRRQRVADQNEMDAEARGVTGALA